MDRSRIAYRPIPKLAQSPEEKAETQREALVWGLATGAVSMTNVDEWEVVMVHTSLPRAGTIEHPKKDSRQSSSPAWQTHAAF